MWKCNECYLTSCLANEDPDALAGACEMFYPRYGWVWSWRELPGDGWEPDPCGAIQYTRVGEREISRVLCRRPTPAPKENPSD